MNVGDRREVAATSNGGAGGIMASIAAVREIIMMGGGPTSQDGSLEDELSAVKQLRYEDRVRLEERIQTLEDKIRGLETKLEQVQRETKGEKILRQTLETTNEALEMHKLELTIQLEASMMSSQELLPSTQDDTSRSLLAEKEKTTTYDKERAIWEEKLKESIQEKSAALKRSGELEARCLESARQIEELKNELLSLNQHIQETRAQHLESVEGHTKTEESLRQRLKELEAEQMTRSAMSTVAAEEGGISTEMQAKLLASERKIEELKTQILTLQVKHEEIVVDHLKSNEDLKRRLQEVEAAHAHASKELEKTKTALEASKRGVSEEELEKEQEVQEKIASKVASLTGSLAKMSERSETMRLELAKLQETASPYKTSKKDGEDLNEKRRQVVYETAKVGAVLETMQGQLEQKLKIARKNAEKSSLDLALVREIWRCAKDDVTECQAELDKCISGIAELEKSAPELSSPAATPTKKRKAVDTAAKSMEKGHHN